MAYGVRRGQLFYEPTDAALPTETVWDTQKYLTFIPDLFDRLRSTYGSAPALLHDVHDRLTPIEVEALIGRFQVANNKLDKCGD